MANLTITVSRHYLDWPLHQTINQADQGGSLACT